MKNLQNFGVQELNAKEIRNTDGGVLGFIVAAMVGGFIYATIEDWDGNVNAFSEGFNETK